MDKIRVLVAEDHTIVRKGICSLLSGDEGIEIAGEAKDGREAIKAAEELHPDIQA